MQNNQQPAAPAPGSKTASSEGKLAGRCLFFLGDTVEGTKIAHFLQGLPYSLFITVVTIITLLSDDFRQIFFPPESDEPFSYLTVCCMSIFTVEMVVLSFVKENYFLKFAFWLDLVSTLSMLLDLVWIQSLINGSTGVTAAAKVAKIARASRASKIGARTTKLIRILRLIRVLKLYKTASKQLSKEDQKKLDSEANNQSANKVGTFAEQEAKRISQKINSQISPFKKVQIDSIKESNQLEPKKAIVSLKNITVQNSNRKLSALHPSLRIATRLKSSVNFRQDQVNSPGVNNEISFQKLQNSPQARIEQKLQSVHGCENEDEIKKESLPHTHSGTGGSLEIPLETRVGMRLKDEIQKNIVSMVLLLLLSIPLLNVDTWYSNTTCYEKSTSYLRFFAGKSTNQFEAQAKVFITEMVQKPYPLIYFSLFVQGSYYEFPTNFSQYNLSVANISSLRTDDTLVYIDGEDVNNITVGFNQNSVNIFASQLNIGMTLFVCTVLIVMTILFTNDVEDEALTPLENMINTVKKISSNPLQAIKDIERENLIKHAIETGSFDASGSDEAEMIRNLKDDNSIQTEPMMLENMIVKIGSLLAIGFGEAGTELISKNIENHGSLNVMMPGRKSVCIYGFCDIRNFTDATEVLESKVMVFVNEIAEICHETVNRVGGNPNKNIGDAFLLVWKFKDDDLALPEDSDEIYPRLQQSLKVKQTADLAVYSFVKIVAEMTRSETLQKYKKNEKLISRIKDYDGVKMGFGLHIGWSIEGPIGSEFKIDASYLGPHVTMSARLEGATKQYGTSMLISGDVYDLMTNKFRQNLRQVDRVTVNFSQQPLNLYTVDISQSNLLQKRGLNKKKELTVLEKKKLKVSHNINRDKLMSTIEKKRVSVNIWNEDKDIFYMRQPFTKQFFQEWKRGFELYQKGDWLQAKNCLQKTLIFDPKKQDGPSKELLSFMKQSDFKAPTEWNGVRQFSG